MKSVFKYLFILISTLFFIHISFSDDCYTNSLSGNAFNVSLGGNAIAYPFSISQTNLVNPSYSSYQSDHNSYSFFNFTYFMKTASKDKKSYSWILTFEDLISYGYIQNRYKGIKDKKIVISLPTGKYFHNSVTFKYREKNHDIDEGLDIGGMITPIKQFAFGWHIENIYPPVINNTEEPWIASAGIGIKPLDYIGISFNVKTGETFDEKYSGGIEFSINNKYSVRSGIDENGKITLGNSFRVRYGFLSITYKYDDNEEREGLYVTFSTNFDKSLE